MQAGAECQTVDISAVAVVLMFGTSRSLIKHALNIISTKVMNCTHDTLCFVYRCILQIAETVERFPGLIKLAWQYLCRDVWHLVLEMCPSCAVFLEAIVTLSTVSMWTNYNCHINKVSILPYIQPMTPVHCLQSPVDWRATALLIKEKMVRLSFNC